MCVTYWALLLFLFGLWVLIKPLCILFMGIYKTTGWDRNGTRMQVQVDRQGRNRSLTIRLK